jgi:RHS repeat-associated protein
VQQVTDALSSPSKYRQFSYDSLGHLRQTIFGTTPTGCSWTMQNGWRCTGGGTDSTHTFAYDSVGNRRDHGGTYTTGNRITAFNGCTYGTDYDGNVTSRSYSAAPCPNQNLTFTWTADNRLASFAVTGGASVTLDYDAFGRLVRRSVNGSPRSYFLWDGDNLLAELDGTAAGKVAEYSWYGLDNLHAIVREAFAHHAETDALGNVRALTNLTGLVTRTNTYDEWGRLIAATDTALGDSARVRWKGALWLGPEAELYYMRNRWYEPWTGRFLSEDAIGLSGGDGLAEFGVGEAAALAHLGESGRFLGADARDCPSAMSPGRPTGEPLPSAAPPRGRPRWRAERTGSARRATCQPTRPLARRECAGPSQPPLSGSAS